MNFIRTNKTNLTDDELILFDGLFWAWTTKKFLRAEEFQERLNFPYVHKFTDQDLTLVFDDLLERRLIKKREVLLTKKSKEKLDYFALTRKGGELWSLERNPNWENYCIDFESPEEDGSHFKIYSLSQQTLKNYVEFEQQLLLTELGVLVEVQFKTLENHFLIPWKRFAKVYVANWTQSFCEIREYYWKYPKYWEQKPKNWNSANELLKSLPKE